MEDLVLDESLWQNIVDWMIPKYSLKTVDIYSTILKGWFKKYKVLNIETTRKIMKTIKHQNYRACLVAINRYCYDSNIPFNIIVPGIKKQPSKLPVILSHSEISLMVNSAPHPYNLAIRCIFNMGAGLRISEIIKMQWDDIGWVDWLSNQDSYGVVNIKVAKRSKDRIVNIPKNLMKDLYEYAKEKKVLNEFRVPSGGGIFDFGGTKMKENTQLMHNDIERWKIEYIKTSYNWFRYNIVQKCCEKAINKKIKIHTLRHSRATYLYEIEKVPIEQIGILLGHSSMNTTMLYTRINPLGIFELIKDTKEI